MAAPVGISGTSALFAVLGSTLSTGTSDVAGNGDAALFSVQASGSGVTAGGPTEAAGNGDATLFSVLGSDAAGGASNVAGSGDAVLFVVGAGGSALSKTYGARRSDFCYLTPTLDGDSEVRFYALASSPAPSKVTAGGTITPRQFYETPARISSTDRYDQEVVQVAGTSAIHTRVSMSRRMGLPTRWETKVGSGDWISWLRTFQNGQGIGGAEDWTERVGGTYLDGTIVHTANHGGAIVTATELLFPDHTYGLHYSPQLYYEALVGTAGTARLRSAVIPLHWLPDGQGASQDPGRSPAELDHGGVTGTTDVLFWDQRLYMDVAPCHGGDESVHKLSFWGFNREGWSDALFPEAAPCTGGITCGLAFCDIFNQLHAFDVIEDTVTDLSGVLLFPADLQATVYTSGTELSVTEAGRWYGKLWQQSPFPSGYGALIYRRTSDDFCVGFAFKLHSSADQCRRPNAAGLINWRHGQQLPYPALGTGGPDTAPYGSGPLLSALASTRAAGWVGISAFLVAGLSLENTVNKIRELYVAGTLDEQPSTDLPAGLLEDTAAVPEYYVPAPPPPVTGAPDATSPDAVIAAIDAAIRDGGDVAAYTVNGRTVQLRSLGEMLKARKYFESLQARKVGLRRSKVQF